MTELDVRCASAGNGWTCQVAVREEGSQTEHEVSVSLAELERFAPGASDPQELVEASFRYLLEREPKEAILRRFEISAIERYFPGYGREIGARLGPG
jgi:hypothetical protein